MLVWLERCRPEGGAGADRWARRRLFAGPLATQRDTRVRTHP